MRSVAGRPLAAHRHPFFHDFRERAEGGGEIGILDAPSFLALLLGWVVTSFLQAFDKIEAELEEFNLRVLRNARRDAE